MIYKKGVSKVFVNQEEDLPIEETPEEPTEETVEEKDEELEEEI